MAKARIDAIAKGDVAAVTSSYADGATLHWVGGPLDGQYTGADKLKEVWGKFTKAQGDQKATVAAIAESANPKGSTVIAKVAFAGKNTVKVRYVMVYRDGKLGERNLACRSERNFLSFITLAGMNASSRLEKTGERLCLGRNRGFSGTAHSRTAPVCVRAGAAARCR